MKPKQLDMFGGGAPAGAGDELSSGYRGPLEDMLLAASEPKRPAGKRKKQGRRAPGALSWRDASRAGVCVYHQDRGGAPHAGDWIAYCPECKARQVKVHKGQNSG